MAAKAHLERQEPASPAELRYRLWRASQDVPTAYPYWGDLEPWIREALTFMRDQ